MGDHQIQTQNFLTSEEIAIQRFPVQQNKVEGPDWLPPLQTLQRPHFPSQKIIDLGVEDEVEAFLKGQEAIMKETIDCCMKKEMPVLDTDDCCCLCPSSYESYFTDLNTWSSDLRKLAVEGKEKLEEGRKAWNEKFAEQGLYFVLSEVPSVLVGYELRLNLPRRRQYCAKNGLVFTEPSIVIDPNYLIGPMAGSAVIVNQPVSNPPPYAAEKSAEPINISTG